MAKKKAFKFISKRLGMIKQYGLKVKKWKKKGRGGSVTRGIKIKDNTGYEIARIEGLSLPNNDLERVMNINVIEGYQGRGLGSKLFEKFLKSSKRRKLSGSVINKDQIKIREKFDGTRTVEKSINTAAYTPTSSKKKILNKTSGKIRFIRVRGRIVPIRSKKQ